MNVNKKSNKQKENKILERMLEVKENIISTVSQYYKNTSLKWISKNNKSISKCNFEKDLKSLKK